MCKTGGPRCPQTPGKKARTKLARAVKAQINQSGSVMHDWKATNDAEYEQMCQNAFAGIESAQEPQTPVAEDPSWIDEYYAQKEEREYESGTPDPWDGDDLTDWDHASEDFDAVNSYLLMHGDDDDEESIYPAEMYEDGDEEAAQERFENLRTSLLSHTLPETEDNSRVPDNSHLIPEDAVIKSPTPNPMFVYGTLRTGEGNYSWALAGKTQKERNDVRLPGARMYSNGGFPYVIDDPEHEQGVRGDLMYPDYDEWSDVVDSLDTLEGTRSLRNDTNLYNRYLMYVQTGEKEYTQAWVYIPPTSSQDHIKTAHPEVESGDWSDVPKWGNISRRH